MYETATSKSRFVLTEGSRNKQRTNLEKHTHTKWNNNRQPLERVRRKACPLEDLEVLFDPERCKIGNGIIPWRPRGKERNRSGSSGGTIAKPTKAKVERLETPRYGLLRIACIPDDWARLFRFRATEFALAGGALAGQASRSLRMCSESAAFIDPTG